MGCEQKTPNTQNRKGEEFPPKLAGHARSSARQSRKQRGIGRKKAQKTQKINNINSCLYVLYVVLRQKSCQKQENLFRMARQTVLRLMLWQEDL
jgi:hypothetical protein